MTRLKDKVIEDTSKLGEIIDLCKVQIDVFYENKYSRYVAGGADMHNRIFYKKELAESILKIIGIEYQSKYAEHQ